MLKIEKTLTDIGYLDNLALQSSIIHRLDPRIKVLTTLAFIITVISYQKYAVSALAPLVLYPVLLSGLAGLPYGYLLRKIAIVAPFAVLIGLFNPFFDTQVLLHVGPMPVSGGWVSFASILLRFVLTISAALILIASTGFTRLCMALEKIGVPKVFAVQLLFVYRYLFLLMEEAARMVRARNLRSSKTRGSGMAVFGHMAGQLLLRTMERAERIHLAMVCRGFDGAIRLSQPLRIGLTEILFLIGWVLFFISIRFYPVSRWLGQWITRILI